MGISWSTSNIPNLDGKTALVTGANSGVGYHTALELAKSGASVVIACRNRERGESALSEMKKEVPNAKLELKLLDLSSLKDVERFATEFNREGRSIDILVNNAGIRSSTYQTTADGFESQIGTNYLGHFALTGQLLPSLYKSTAPRVVSVGSLRAHQASNSMLANGETRTRSTAHLIDVDFVKSKETFVANDCYAESKLGSLIFMRELGKRCPRITSTAAHPGGCNTNIVGEDLKSELLKKILLQSPAYGAYPLLRAAADPSAVTGSYFGPRYGFRGRSPLVAWFPKLGKDDELAAAYWDSSVKATGVRYW